MFRLLTPQWLAVYNDFMNMSLKYIMMTELTHRQARNAAYSLRAFARDLGVSLTALSDVLNGKRAFSKKNTEKIIASLGLSPLVSEKIREGLKKVSKTEEERTLLAEDEFRLISDWYYLAILNLAKLKEAKSSPSWIAKRLALDLGLVRPALERLLRMKLIKLHKGRLLRTSKALTTTIDIPSAAIRNHHAQNLQKAEYSLHHVPVELREFGSVTMSTNLDNLQKAKTLLLKTRKKIADLLEGGQATEVYTLSFQLFPVTKVGPSDSAP